MHSALQAAVGAQHVKDMLDQAARDSRAREARLGRARRTHRAERRARLSRPPPRPPWQQPAQACHAAVRPDTSPAQPRSRSAAPALIRPPGYRP